jgi:hypothetical protein
MDIDNNAESNNAENNEKELIASEPVSNQTAFTNPFTEEFDDKDVIRGISVEESDDSAEGIDFEKPFADEFDPKDIVNRGISSDYIVDDMLRLKEEQERIERNKMHYYMSKKELDSLINDNPRMKIFQKNEKDELIEIEVEVDNVLQNLISKSIDAENELIEITVPMGNREALSGNKKTTTEKQEDTTNTSEIAPKTNTDGGDYYQHNISEDDEEVYYMSEEEMEEKRRKERMQETLKAVQDVIDALAEKGKYVDPEILYEKFLQETFNDYLLAKKISGTNKVKYADKIVAQEDIKSDTKQVEISDAHATNISTGEKTSMLINRDEELNIESIEVYCKCGEKTIIRFIEQEGLDVTDETTRQIESKSLTDIVVDTIDVMPIFDPQEDED